MSEIELDPELLADFIVESRELLDEFSENVMELERRPAEERLIGAIFRSAHTLKGSSAFFNLIHIKNFSHKLENLLDDLRNHRRTANAEIIEILLQGAGFLRGMFERVSTGEYSTSLDEREEAFLSRLVAYLETTPGEAGEEPMGPEALLLAVKKVAAGPHPAEAELRRAMDEINRLLATVGEVAPEPEPSEADATTGGKRYLLGSLDLTASLGRMMELLREGMTQSFDEAAFDQALTALESLVEKNGIEDLKPALTEVADDFRAVRDSSVDFDELIVSVLLDKSAGMEKKVKIVTAEAEPTPKPEAGPAVPEAAAPPPAASQERHDRKTMRIDEDKVDGFMSYVGELIVTAESFNYLQKMIEQQHVHPQTIRAFKNANQAFRELSGELQESLMEIRRIPIKGLLQKVTLMARDLAHQMNKQIQVDLEGQEVQVDKSIAENLEGPLVHVVRNSLDHGLEPPEERAAAGKDPKGRLRVTASTDKEFFLLVVEDDGRGIKPEAIRRAAVSKGMMSESQASSLSDREAVNLVFAAGFSTAKEITDVSGRGVGMDVVRNNIAQLNGSISLESKPGEGTVITLKIPVSVTLQVIRGLLVRVGEQHYIINLDDILESLRPAAEDLTTIEGRGEVIRRRGQILPLIRLHEIFQVDTRRTDPMEAILVVVQTQIGRFALLVDEVLGQQQVVVKELNVQFKNLTFLAGSATLGDGRLGLVLDAEGVVRLALGR